MEPLYLMIRIMIKFESVSRLTLICIVMVCDEAKELVARSATRTLPDASSHLQTVDYSPHHRNEPNKVIVKAIYNVSTHLAFACYVILYNT